jgi:hypothetical protein
MQAVAEQDRFVIFVAAPEHDEMYMSQNRRIEFYNRVVGAGHGSVVVAIRSDGLNNTWLGAMGMHGRRAAQRPRGAYLCPRPIHWHALRLPQVALPLSLDDIMSRLRCGYYRQPPALAADIATLAANAATFNGADSPLAEDAQALAEYLTAVMQGQVRGLGGVGGGSCAQAAAQAANAG